MAKYTSRYAELSFYVNGELRKFHSGEYRTDDAAEIAVLDGLVDANCTEAAAPVKAPKTSGK